MVTWHRRWWWRRVQRGCCEKGWVARQRTSTLKPPSTPSLPAPAFARPADEDSVDTRAPVFALRSGIPQFPFSRVPGALSRPFDAALSGTLKTIAKTFPSLARSWLFRDRRGLSLRKLRESEASSWMQMEPPLCIRWVGGVLEGWRCVSGESCIRGNEKKSRGGEEGIEGTL